MKYSWSEFQSCATVTISGHQQNKTTTEEAIGASRPHSWKLMWTGDKIHLPPCYCLTESERKILQVKRKYHEGDFNETIVRSNGPCLYILL